MRNAIRNLLVMASLAGVLSASVFAAEEATPRQRPSPEQRAQHHEQMKQRWNKLDANHDGKISREEAQQNAPKLAEHFDKLDANGDGQLTQEEMRQARQARQANKSERHSAQPSAESRSGT